VGTTGGDGWLAVLIVEKRGTPPRCATLFFLIPKIYLRPMQHREIFTAKYLREVGKHFDLLRESPTLLAIRQHVADWQASFNNGTIIKQSEIQLQKEFLSTFFAGCLGYHTKIGRNDWELDYEQTTEVDATRADGYLGFFTPNGQKTIAVIELKDASTDLDRPQNRKNDKRSPVEQAFSYVPKVGQDCRWVIVSNFVEIRLYHAQDQGRYEYFHITQLHQDEQLWRFLFLLHRDRLLPHGSESYLEHYHRQRLEQEQTISLDFYKEFKEYRQRLFQHLKVQNPEQPELLLFEKTQKLLDRIIFVLFCEDKGLLPVDIIRKVRQAAHASLDPSEGQGFWGQLKGLFRSIDKGNPALNINRYNGGLFAHDPELDELRLDDSMVKVILGLSRYDFDSDLNVNILGHIFEQSISDIEEIKADIGRVAHLEGVPHVPAKQSKRKKDGIFYTPEYITRYIVREAVGGWLDDRKRALGFDTLPELSLADLDSIKSSKGRSAVNATIEKHRAAWIAYREVLANIKVLDPACGSGAFLIQVFDYLSAEGEGVNEKLAQLSSRNHSIDDLSRNILTNNIFGVDINAESVEISKLALWLKTANIHSELNSLDQNIKCGNSLIDDPAVAGDLAFDWETEFAEIFEQKGGFDVVVEIRLM
jgi:type I restriction-modification system DNA methylase subunit